MSAQVGQAKLWNRPGRRLPWIVSIMVGGRRVQHSWPTKAAAVAYQGRLNGARDRGEQFDAATGEPCSWAGGKADTVPDVALAMVTARRASLRAPSRKSLAEAAAHVVAACTPVDRADGYTAAFAVLAGGQVSVAQRNVWRRMVQTGQAAAGLDLRGVCAVLGSNLDGTPAAPTTVRRRRSALSQIVEEATGARPMLPALPRTAKSKGPAIVSPSRIGTPDQVWQVIGGCASEGTRRALTLMFLAGLRPSEAVALRWEYVDMDAGVLTVAESTPTVGTRFTDGGGRFDVQPPKARADGAARLVPMVPALVEMLTGWGPGRGRVCLNRRGGPIPSGDLSKAWGRARAGVDGWPGARLAVPYDLRHTHASLALSAGVPVRELAERLGHSPEVLLSTYAECVPADRARWTGVLAGALG